MPTYEYQCKDCGHRFDRFQSIKADPLTECEQCDGVVERLISAGGGLLFKGSGFYITDYRSEGYRQKAKSDSANGTSSGGTSSGDAASKASSSKAEG